MNQVDFNKLVEDTIEATAQLLVVKGGEYAGSDDRLANFKRGAELTGCTPLQVAFVYMSKHYDAVATAIRDQATGNERPRSEPIGGRLDDLINYCLLVKALFAEVEASLVLRCECDVPLILDDHGVLSCKRCHRWLCGTYVTDRKS